MSAQASIPVAGRYFFQLSDGSKADLGTGTGKGTINSKTSREGTKTEKS